MKKSDKKRQTIRKCISVAGMLILAALVVLLASKMERSPVQQTSTEDIQKKDTAKDSLLLWYYDSTYDAYMENLCANYKKETGVSLTAVKVSAESYLENINQANIQKEERPDLFLLGSEQIEKAYLAGLLEVNEKDKIYTEENCAQAALAAIMYNEKKVAYPFAFDTCYMVYNTKYTEQAPATFDDILEYANQFDGEKYPDVRTLLEWDVSDIMFNYGFVGSYIQCGGEYGDDESIFDVWNKDLKEALKYYKELQRFFSIEMDSVSYKKVKSDFYKGRIVYAMVQLDFVREMEGEVSFAICQFPDLNKDLQSRTLSNTTVIGINPYSDQQKEAEQLAVFMTTQNVQDVYEQTGKMSAWRQDYEDEKLNQIYQCYESSAGMPKLMSASDFRMKLQIALNNIWNGANINDTMKGLNKEIGVNLDKKS